MNRIVGLLILRDERSDVRPRIDISRADTGSFLTNRVMRPRQRSRHVLEQVRSQLGGSRARRRRRCAGRRGRPAARAAARRGGRRPAARAWSAVPWNAMIGGCRTARDVLARQHLRKQESGDRKRGSERARMPDRDRPRHHPPLREPHDHAGAARAPRAADGVGGGDHAVREPDQIRRDRRAAVAAQGGRAASTRAPPPQGCGGRGMMTRARTSQPWNSGANPSGVSPRPCSAITSGSSASAAAPPVTISM